jgi:hypothetical protein
MTETAAACAKCQGPINGRRSDSRYCSGSCKLASEYERRWIDRRLSDLRTFQSNGRLMLLPRKQLARTQAEINRLEERLRELLGGS